MKTTVDISDSLFQQARNLAQKQKTTFRQVVESALRTLLKVEAEKKTPYRYKDCSVRGNGLVDGLQEGDWTEIRKRAYEGRGG